MAMHDVKLTLNGRERALRYDFNVLGDTEPYTGRSVLEVVTHLGELRWSDLRALVWAGLQHEGPTAPSIREVGEELHQYLADGGRLGPLYGTIRDALERSGCLGKRDDAEKNGASPAPVAPGG